MKRDGRPTIEVEGGGLVEPWPWPDDVERLFSRLSRLPHCLFLDSARRQATLGRYSFLTADPFEVLVCLADGSDALAELENRLAAYAGTTIANLPPFQGGAAGLLSYDLGRSLEPMPRLAVDEFEVPALAVGFYDVVLAIDHVENRAWLISQGFPEVGADARRGRARARLEMFRNWLCAASSPAKPQSVREQTRACALLAPQHRVPGPKGLTSNSTRDQYLAATRRAIEHIHAGDVFQVNLAQRLQFPAAVDAASLYLRLRRCNAAPFAGYFDLGESQIVSASPERFLRLAAGEVEARPIKGTRPRLADPASDGRQIEELLTNEKDRAENIMIVDLLRNDLSRVCRADSVRVTQLCQLESYEYVHHLVSAVCGRLAEGQSAIGLLRAAFPGGSVTGAPKVRAMHIIAALEPTARGAYCGSLGYIGFDGTMDTSILIRTITASGGWWTFPVGGGIVAQSIAEREYEETWDKRKG